MGRHTEKKDLNDWGMKLVLLFQAIPELVKRLGKSSASTYLPTLPYHRKVSSKVLCSGRAPLKNGQGFSPKRINVIACTLPYLHSTLVNGITFTTPEDLHFST